MADPLHDTACGRRLEAYISELKTTGADDSSVPLGDVHVSCSRTLLMMMTIHCSMKAGVCLVHHDQSQPLPATNALAGATWPTVQVPSQQKVAGRHTNVAG